MKTRRFTAMLLTLAMVLSLCCVSALAADASVSDGGVTLQFGDPAMEATWPESVMSLDGANGTYTAVYEGSDAAYYYPDTLSLYADCGDTSLTLTGSGVKFATYSDAVETLHDSITTAENGADLFTLKIQSAGTVTVTAGTSTVTIHYSAPKSDYPLSTIHSHNTPILTAPPLPAPRPRWWAATPLPASPWAPPAAMWSTT